VNCIRNLLLRNFQFYRHDTRRYTYYLHPAARTLPHRVYESSQPREKQRCTKRPTALLLLLLLQRRQTIGCASDTQIFFITEACFSKRTTAPAYRAVPATTSTRRIWPRRWRTWLLNYTQSWSATARYSDWSTASCTSRGPANYCATLF